LCYGAYIIALLSSSHHCTPLYATRPPLKSSNLSTYHCVKAYNIYIYIYRLYLFICCVRYIVVVYCRDRIIYCYHYSWPPPDARAAPRRPSMTKTQAYTLAPHTFRVRRRAPRETPSQIETPCESEWERYIDEMRAGGGDCYSVRAP